MICKDDAESSNMTDTKSWWNYVWKMKVPLKVKHFIWRVSHSWLPVNFELSRRNIPVMKFCQMCGICDIEDISHSLWRCPSISHMWKLAGLKAYITNNPDRHPLNFMNRLMEIYEEDFNFFAIVSWQIWSIINRYMHGYSVPRDDDVLEWCYSFLKDYQMAKYFEKRSVPKSNCRWRLPSVGEFKINVNAAVGKTNGGTGLGAIIRDDKGCCVASASRFIKVSNDIAIINKLFLDKNCSDVDCLIEDIRNLAVNLKWPKTFKVFDKPFIPANLFVIYLKRSNGQWDESFIKNIFNSEDAQTILKIPWGSNEIKDKIIWHYSKNGEYSVKSGYKAAMICKDDAESSNMTYTKSWWNYVWKMIVPPKVKHFIWRVSHSWLPVNFELSRRNIPVMKFCQMCGICDIEDISHSLWRCPSISHMWKLVGLKAYITNNPDRHPLNFMNRLRMEIYEEDFNLFAIVPWQIWSIINRYMHGYSVPRDDDVLEWC
ncbi:hypothetical protein POM88_046193 [Heracleum sosnowskyi]|uniref:Reverse transcriptase zinc-binding domain-containing protein n=1 Tax=Heracleum sosnowskyi TaxID=360622 RepID=A0AAD8H761_9APIA|nr:hypothetical protein POM88_046193 [Heracleum sosnowskyi]